MIFNLPHITTLELLQMPEDASLGYWELMNVLNSQPMFGRFKATELNDLKFGQVANLKETIQDPDYESLKEAFNYVFGVNENQLLMTDVVQFLAALRWLRESIVKLMEKEAKALSGEVDQDLIAAGINRLNRFGDMNPCIAIGKEFGFSPQEVEEWQYKVVLTIMLHSKISSEIQSEYMKIKTKSNGH